MPKIPTVTPQSRTGGNVLRVPDTSGDATVGDGLQTLGRAVSKTSDMLYQREAQREVGQLTSRLSDLQIQFDDRLSEAVQNAGRGDDIVGQVTGELTEQVSRLHDGVSTRIGQNYLTKNAAKLQLHFNQKAAGAQAELRSAFAQEDYSESLSKWSATIVTDPSSLGVTMELHETAVEALGEAYGLSAADKANLRREGDKTLTRASIRGAIREDSKAALARLREGPVPNIDPDEQQKWIDMAVTAVEQEQRAELQARAQQEKLAEEEQERLRAETAKTGWELLARNELDVEWIFENRDSLNKSDYKLLLDKAAGGSVETNPNVYADLRTRAGSGEDVTSQARTALENNQIRISDFNNILNEIETNSPRAQTPAWYKQGREYIRGQIGGENANPFELQVQSRVMDDWTAWARAHPDVSISDARDKYREYANEGLLVTGNTVGLPVPKFFAGTRTEPDLGATYRALKKARENGEIEEFEYQRQLQLIADWKQRIENQQRVQSRPKKTEAQ